MKTNSAMKFFDKGLLELLFLNGLGIAFLLMHFYAFPVTKALLISPILSVMLFLAIIAFAHIFSLTMDLFDKGISLLK